MFATNISIKLKALLYLRVLQELQENVHLQLLNDVLVVRATQGLLPGSCAGRDPPVFGSSLHHVAVDLKRQSVDLAVQVDWDGNGSCLG